MNFNKETYQKMYGVPILDEKNRNDAKRKIVARWVVETLTPVLWFAFVGTFFSCAFNASCIGWIFWATVLNFAGRFLRESYGVWRDYPYWRSVETTRESNLSVAIPFWTTNILFLIVLFLRKPLWTVFIVAWFLFFIDLVLACWTRRFAEKTIRTGIELLRSNEFRAEPVDGTESTSTEKKEELSLEKSVFSEDSDQIFDSENEQAETIISTQRRTKTPIGEERISGEAFVSFDDDAEVAVVNISFCPSFEGTPTFEFEQVSGPEVAIKTTIIQPFGVRLEARRRNANEENESTIIEYFASYIPPREKEEE